MKTKILRLTKSVCPICINEIPANIVEEKNKIFMTKRCEKHGKFKVLISNDADYYKELSELFLRIPVRDNKETFYLFPTAKCNQNCEICYIDTHNLNYKDLDIKDIKKTINFRNKKISLIGGEPTIRKDLPELIKVLKGTKNSVSVFTNGKKISNLKYLENLKKAGVDEICLQFDGFNDRFYKKFRNEYLINYKKRALENLKILNIPTLLESVIIKNENEDQIKRILDYGVKNRFIKAIGFNSYRNFGKGKLGHEKSVTNDKIIEVLEKVTSKKINKKDIFALQKVIYILYYLGILKPRGCFNHHYYLIIRNHRGYSSISEYMNLDKFEKKSKAYLKKSKYNKIIFPFLLFNLFKPKTIKLLVTIIRIMVARLKRKNIGLNSFPKNFLSLQFVSPCDKYTFDFEVSKYCANNEIIDGEYSLSGFNNIIREKKFIKTKWI